MVVVMVMMLLFQFGMVCNLEYFSSEVEGVVGGMASMMMMLLCDGWEFDGRFRL